MLTKAVGVSQLIYAASMLTVPEPVIQKTQAELFAFLWRNKEDKIRRQIIYQPISDRGLNFINFRTMIKSLRLSWIGRLLDGRNANWNVIPNYFFNKHGGLTFLLNYDVNLFKANFPLFYRKLLEYFQELSRIYGGDPKGQFVLWKNKDIMIDQKTLFLKTWFKRGIYFVQDLLSKDRKFLSLDEFNEKFGLKVNYLQYFQIIAAIPSSLKQTAMQTPISSECLFSTPDLLYLSKDSTLPLSKMRCKHYYKLFNECWVSEPFGIKKRTENFLKVFS